MFRLSVGFAFAFASKAFGRRLDSAIWPICSRTIELDMISQILKEHVVNAV